MKATALLLCALVHVTASSTPRKKADKQFLEKQQNLLELFVNVKQTNYNQQQQQIGNHFDFDKHQDNFSNTYAVKQFQNAYKQGLLLRGEIFNYNNLIHLREAIQLFDIFYFANDYDTFYEAACWARDRVNEGQFVYALSIAIVKRKDTQHIALPPQSEIYPSLYVNARAIQQAQKYKQQGRKSVTVESNTTGIYPSFQEHRNPNYYPYDSWSDTHYHNKGQYNGRVSYFNEDKNLNQLFAIQQINYPNWFNEEKYGPKWQQQNGERFYYYLQQLLARYNLERYANDLPAVQPFQFNRNINPGYNPQLQYYNGQSVPARPNDMNFNNANYNYFQQLQKIDRRIADAIDSQQVKNEDGSTVKLTAENGSEILGNLVQANTNSINKQYYSAQKGLYGYLDLFRRVVGSITDPEYQYQVAPGVIENESIACRDPVFYQIVSQVVSYLQTFKNQLKPYSQNQLIFQGVTVQALDVDKLVTYFDNSEVDLYNAIYYQPGEQAEHFYYKAQQQQLNYKSFNYKLQVNSAQETDAVVRIFIGPRYNVQGEHYYLDQARQYFVEIDRFVVNLKSGQNTINRNSQESTMFVDEQTGVRSLISQVQQAQQGGQPFYVTEGHNTQQASFPQNLLLPRGSSEGFRYELFVAVNSYQPSDQKLGQNVNPPNDDRAQGFPLDRHANDIDFKHAPNFFFKTITIFHKKKSEINQL